MLIIMWFASDSERISILGGTAFIGLQYWRVRVIVWEGLTLGDAVLGVAL